jgi:hypothetical protein
MNSIFVSRRSCAVAAKLEKPHEMEEVEAKGGQPSAAPGLHPP